MRNGFTAGERSDEPKNVIILHNVLSFRCIRRLFEVVETLGRVHLVTEWIQGGELYNRISQDGPLKEIYAASLFKQLLMAVQHMVRTPNSQESKLIYKLMDSGCE